MALIKCPECGKEVSDRAGSCPQCGFPLSTSRQDGIVAIKLLERMAGTVIIKDLTTSKVVWTGKSGQIARFPIEHPMRIGIGWGAGKVPYSAGATAEVHAGRKYELVLRQGFFTVDVCINEVDMFDAGR